MTSIIDLNPFDLEKLSIKNYFKTIESKLGKENSVDKLTNFFTAHPFSETKPYLTRRHLKPIDTRFRQIELVYEKQNTVRAIVWDLNIILSQLIDIFGVPIIHNEPYDYTTGFAFKSNNPNIGIIKTRHSEWLKKLNNKNAFEYKDKTKQKVELKDTVFSFIQFDLAD